MLDAADHEACSIAPVREELVGEGPNERVGEVPLSCQSGCERYRAAKNWV